MLLGLEVLAGSTTQTAGDEKGGLDSKSVLSAVSALRELLDTYRRPHRSAVRRKPNVGWDGPPLPAH